MGNNIKNYIIFVVRYYLYILISNLSLEIFKIYIKIVLSKIVKKIV